MPAPTTYRLTLTDERTGRVVVDHEHMEGKKVEAALEALAEAGPMIKMATGASKAWDGISQLLDGYAATRPRRIHTGKRR